MARTLTGAVDGSVVRAGGARPEVALAVVVGQVLDDLHPVALHPQVEEADGVGAHGDGRGGGAVSSLEAGPVEGDALVFHGDHELARAPQKEHV